MESRTERKEQMKHLTIAATLILAGVIGYGVAAHAQPAGGGKADPVKVDPKHYKVEFENASVRVLRISYAPGEKSVMHYHPNAVAVYLTDDDPHDYAGREIAGYAVQGRRNRLDARRQSPSAECGQNAGRVDPGRTEEVSHSPRCSRQDGTGGSIRKPPSPGWHHSHPRHKGLR